MNKIFFTIVAYVLDLIGTVYAVLSILNLTLEEVWTTITYGGIMNADRDKLAQRRQARMGIWLVFCGFILNCILQFIKNIETDQMLDIMTFAILLIVGTGTYAVNAFNEKFERDYRKKSDDEKAGVVEKTYKLKKESVKLFSKYCSDRNLNEAEEISKLMKKIVEEEK